MCETRHVRHTNKYMIKSYFFQICPTLTKFLDDFNSRELARLNSKVFREICEKYNRL